MRKLVLLLLLVPLVSFGQFDNSSFSGLIKTSDSVVFPYEINITRIGNSISGFSISDKGGASETKTSFEISRINKELLFKEKHVIYTKANYNSFDDFCLVTFKINEKKFFKSNKIKIEFKGVFSDESRCIDGSLNLISKSFINNKFSKANKKIERNKVLGKKFGDSIKIIKEKLNLVREQLFKSEEVIFKKNNKLMLNINEPYKILIKDYSVQDGDEINMKINDNEVKKIYISEKPFYFNINNNTKKNKLLITGTSEGKYPPITASIIIQDLLGKTIQKIKLELKEEESNELILNLLY